MNKLTFGSYLLCWWGDVLDISKIVGSNNWGKKACSMKSDYGT